MSVNLRFLCHEESADLFKTGVLGKALGVFACVSVHWVVPHEVLSQEDAGVESVLDALVDLPIIGVHQSVDFSRQLLQTRHQSWVDAVGKVDVEVFGAVRQVNDGLLRPQDLLDDNGILVELVMAHVLLVLLLF